jgi:hypothetical protein
VVDANSFLVSQSWFLPTVIILGVWSMIWKGFALYRAGSRRDKVWFTVLFLVNTLGILEIFYIFVFSKNSKTAPTKN